MENKIAVIDKFRIAEKEQSGETKSNMKPSNKNINKFNIDYLIYYLLYAKSTLS